MALLLLCSKIFFVRILDVSLGTVRMIMTVKGKKAFASTIGFIEILIWFLVVQEALTTDNPSIWIAIAYAGGFATGTFIGSLLSERFIQGNLSVQVVLQNQDNDIVNSIREAGFAVSVVEVLGREINHKRYMLLIEINKRQFNQLRSLVKKLDPKAFITVKETQYVLNGFIK
ncbi:MAG: DUF5698 domain-containing protein [Bacilli bacterium]|nr:DUF5698 domain-containing protein [Bacilli bacterium]MDD4808990.1 DUF5698 domain-containing protein [Bacilli bacterium]